MISFFTGASLDHDRASVSSDVILSSSSGGKIKGMTHSRSCQSMSTFTTQTDGASVQKAATDDTAVRPSNDAPSNASEQLPAPEKATMKLPGQSKAAAEVTQDPTEGPNAQASVKLRRKPQQTQEELSQKLEEFRRKSRSTVVNPEVVFGTKNLASCGSGTASSSNGIRPARAKSEEADGGSVLSSVAKSTNQPASSSRSRLASDPSPASEPVQQPTDVSNGASSVAANPLSAPDIVRKISAGGSKRDPTTTRNSIEKSHPEAQNQV